MTDKTLGVDRQEASAMIERLRDESELCANEGADDISDLLDEATETIERLTDALTARDEALASIRVFAQDCIENGYFDKGALGNLYSIRDLCDSKGEAK